MLKRWLIDMLVKTPMVGNVLSVSYIPTATPVKKSIDGLFIGLRDRNAIVCSHPAIIISRKTLDTGMERAAKESGRYTGTIHPTYGVLSDNATVVVPVSRKTEKRFVFYVRDDWKRKMVSLTKSEYSEGLSRYAKSGITMKATRLQKLAIFFANLLHVRP